jgi:hypothetical protein
MLIKALLLAWLAVAVTIGFATSVFAQARGLAYEQDRDECRRIIGIGMSAAKGKARYPNLMHQQMIECMFSKGYRNGKKVAPIPS